MVDVRETWIHTHFLTDAQRISVHHTRFIKKETEKFLRTLGIVFGIHFREFKGEKGVRIVLECRPFPQDLDKIKNYLENLIKDIPSRPVDTKIKVSHASKK